jgi:hypothetical protein
VILTGIESDRTVPLAAATPRADSMSVAELMAKGTTGEVGQFLGTGVAQAIGLTPYAYRQTSYVDLTNSRQLALEASYDGIIDVIRKASGVSLENPERGGYFDEADRRATAREQTENLDPNGFDSRRIEARRAVFDERLNELLAGRPELKDPLAAAKIDYAPDMIARRAQMEFEARASAANVVGQIGGALAGGLGASFRDPVQVATLPFGGSAGTARSAIARVAQTFLQEAAINAGIVAVMQPDVQAWRNQVGLESGVVPGLENIGLAALFGGAFGGGLQAGAEVFRALRAVPQLEPGDKAAVLAVLNGEATPDQAERALRAVGLEITPELRGQLDALRQAHDAEAVIAGPPAGIAPEAHAEAANAAMRHAEDPVAAPPPEPPLPAPKAARSSPVLADDAPAPVAPGGAFEVLGKPVGFRSIAPDALETDAAVFQYKGGGDASGVTDRLRSVGRWDPLATGKAVVYERADGSLVIADGHQRLGLARRMVADGQTDVRLDAYVFREADGWEPADVRAIAAKKNIQEGSGDALDTARILRERPELFDNTLPVGDVKVRQGVALARLSDEAWGMALAGVVPPHYAAHVGSMVPNPALHAAVMQDLVRADPANEAAARFVVAESLASGTVVEVQESLFGRAEVTRSLMLERTKVFGEATKILKREKVAFRTLLANAEILERAGNVVERDASAKAVGAAELVAGLVEKLATRAGPVSDALTRAAAAMAEGAPREKVARTFLSDVLSIVERDGLAGLEAKPRLAPETPIEPGSAEAAAQADTLTIDMFEAPPASERTAAGEQTLMPGVAPVTDRDRAQVAAAKPLTGGDAAPPAGGLFDETARNQVDMLDMLPAVASDGSPTVMRREDAIAAVERKGLFGDLVASCTV